MASSDDLRAEYLLLQNMYEDYDKRALSLKAIAGPLLGAGVAAGLKEASAAILIASIAVALSLWLLEAIWKSFQYCLVARIERLEAWFRGETAGDIAPFQIYTAWGESWPLYRRSGNVARIAMQPFVALPYVVLVSVAALGIALA
ncbi:hypothetical protein MZO42_02310 [Sphingomonas psychrotolerans]|uniref:Uncharacterized protein n=1 Tax=Sphingomonas psychrotolerans TaxID=1327635 RepID=A0ABU3MYZ2_9SPHN|nr:hypothetical protein [Sphingomonas psychrotolerans]MDT8757519.1 hypothetical protein [Sphingomonas psychrotolerans]